LKSGRSSFRTVYTRPNMVYYDDVRVPVENTVGEVGKGWGIGKYLLAHERMSGGSLGPHKKLLIQLKSIAADGETSGFCA
ncbi:MAG: hypothetical protein VX930_01425, partial [Pseudomonadota bacterium]|nr:hypothetical protein [Pseudomonadota bacterium]